MIDTGPNPRRGCQLRLPAPLSPLLQVWALSPEGGVVAVAGVDPGLVGELAEELVGHFAVEGGEALGVPVRAANAARKCQGLSRVNTGFGCGGPSEQVVVSLTRVYQPRYRTEVARLSRSRLSQVPTKRMALWRMKRTERTLVS
jgi:hypothetical protein